MAKQLPEKWNSLNVANDLGLRGDYPRNLAVYKVKNTSLGGLVLMTPSKQVSKQLVGVRNKEKNFNLLVK